MTKAKLKKENERLNQLNYELLNKYKGMKQDRDYGKELYEDSELN